MNKSLFPKRWLKLEGTTLSMYTNDKAVDLLMLIDLKQAEIRKISHYEFSISYPPLKSIGFICQSETQVDTWISKLVQCQDSKENNSIQVNTSK